MKKFITILFIAVFLAGGWAPQAGAALNAVGPVNAANGFPQWYEDTNLLRLDLCLDQNGFCLTEEPNPAAPISFPDNFGPEAFWWNAETTAANAGISGLLVLAMEAAFLNEIPVPGDQVAFARIRIRVDVPTPGAYTVTHPFGVAVFNIAALVAGNEINVTQDIGVLIAGDFNTALTDDPLQAGTVNADGRSIGPFLVPADGSRVTDPVTGNVYLANPASTIQVIGSPFSTNLFRIEGPGGIVAENDLFSLMGKVSGCLAGNIAPTAAADFGAAATGQPQIINLTANDTAGANVPVVPINPASITVTTPPLAGEGTVVKNFDGTVTFTPAAGFSGNSSFTYTVQDMCALTSAPMTVPLIVENLVADKAEFRARTGKWTIKGASSHPTVTLPPPAGDGVTATPNVVILHKGTPTGPVIGTAPVQADGTWKFVGKSKTPPGALPLNIQMESAATVKITKPLRMK